MENIYNPAWNRSIDTQYRDRMEKILRTGRVVTKTAQGVPALTCFGRLHQMVFDLSNGVPLISERKLTSWKKAIAEIIAFIHGARTIDEIKSFGCPFWNSYEGEGTGIGLGPNDMGPGSYGPVFAKYERKDGTTLNQIENILDQIKEYPDMRTHVVTNWRPDYTGRGENRKVIVAPCHGYMHFRAYEDGTLDLIMNQRSADFPVGVPHNMIQYAALLLMVCQVTGYKPASYIHGFLGDAHIYENQIPYVREMLTRDPRKLPTLHLDPSVKNLFDFRPEHFSYDEYDPHPEIKDIPYSP